MKKAALVWAAGFVAGLVWFSLTSPQALDGIARWALARVPVPVAWRALHWAGLGVAFEGLRVELPQGSLFCPYLRLAPAWSPWGALGWEAQAACDGLSGALVFHPRGEALGVAANGLRLGLGALAARWGVAGVQGEAELSGKLVLAPGRAEGKARVNAAALTLPAPLGEVRNVRLEVVGKGQALDWTLEADKPPIRGQGRVRLGTSVANTSLAGEIQALGMRWALAGTLAKPRLAPAGMNIQGAIR